MISAPGFALPMSEFYKSRVWKADKTHANRVNREILRCRVVPQIPAISKIIYDQSTGNMYVNASINSRRFTNNLSYISGFRMGWPILDNFQWSDTLYISYGLAKRPEGDRKWRLHPENWEK
jgi:hypothetical protein